MTLTACWHWLLEMEILCALSKWRKNVVYRLIPSGDRPWDETGSSRFVGRSMLALPTERGEALKATGLEAACRLSIFSYGKASLRGGMPWSGIRRRNGVPIETLPGRKAETD